jgi:putative peptidoglycan lipid II flippase
MPMTRKFTSTVAGASILLTTVGLLSRGLGMIREIVFAGSFGLSSQYDIFLVGTIIPLTINTIVIYIAQNYFIPVYNRLKSNFPDEAKSFVIKALIMFTLGGILVMTVMFFLSDEIIRLYLNSPTSGTAVLAVEVFRIYLVTIPLNAAFAVLAAFLYSEFDFKLPTFSQLFVNVAVIISVIFFSGNIGVLSIAFGYLTGICLQLIFILIYTFRTKTVLLSIKEGGKKLLYPDKGLLIIIIIESLSQVYVLSDRYFLSEVAKGGIAALNYSLNLFQLPVVIISVALSIALFPSFSKSFVDNNVGEIKEKLNKFFSINLYLFVPLTFIYVFFGDIIVRVIFQRGAFSLNDSYMTFETLRYLSISLIFYSSYAVLNKLLYSMELVRQLFIITVVGCIIKIMFNFIIVKYLEQEGLALSTSISYIFFFVSSLMLVRKKLDFNINKILISKLIYIILNASIAFWISSLFMSNILPSGSPEIILQICGLILFIIVFFINTLTIESGKIFNTYRLLIRRIF